MLEFLAAEQLYIVMTVVLINWFGIVYYLFRLDSRLSKIEKKFEGRK